VSGEPETLTPPWAYYRRTGLSEMRPYVLDEDLGGISVSDPDLEFMSISVVQGRDPGGYIARNPKNHADQWYVAQAYFDANLEPLDEPATARDEAAELRAALEAVWSWLRSEFPAAPDSGDSVEKFAEQIWLTVCAALAASEGQP